MILDKPPLPGDEVDLAPEDAPPSYDALDNVPPPLPRDEKAGPSTSHHQRLPHDEQQQPSPTTGSLKSPSALSNKAVGKRPASVSGSSWFNFGPSARAAKEVRSTIKGLLRDLVKQTDSQGAIGVLESCADACRAYDVSLSALLQERSVEGHTPIYWAIINRPPEPPRPDEPDIVTALLSHAAPLSDSTIDELRLACLHTSDHGLFQRLRRSPAFAPLSGSDEIILGGNVPVDDIEVEDVEGDEAGFIANFRIPMFQKRMRISQEINLEFIAKGRLWSFKFFVAKHSDPRLGHHYVGAGSWVAALSLLPHSPPTYIDSRLVIDDPRARTHRVPSQPHPSGPPTSLEEAVDGMMRQAEAESAASPVSTSPRDQPKPRIELRMKRSEQLTAPTSMRAAYYPAIHVSLEEDVRAKNLQFKGCPYIEPDGSLVARLEARLVQSESECIVC
ncbi:hypothetical protein PYCCODRAFT_1398622 [Trametes coccinea BRFM310]|uniref:Uncharacterized protein n=1 Tax=Trametes coccinea (strain BRFM310) TaxID=1353009 RepID=A0A1Y2I8Y2_TRAC3|nr:hypothetical protein PYCCODRAFT_1398622 [Trametes coccinea BRFM310]